LNGNNRFRKRGRIGLDDDTNCDPGKARGTHDDVAKVSLSKWSGSCSFGMVCKKQAYRRLKWLGTGIQPAA
jgi:hypothetical protein